MLNEECLCAVMRYLEKNLVPDSKGKNSGIKSRIICDALQDAFPSSIVNHSIGVLYELGFIKKTNPENKDQKPNAFKINGITSKGYEYLRLVQDDTLWKKLQKKLSVENILNMLSLGSTATQLLQNFLGK